MTKKYDKDIIEQADELFEESRKLKTPEEQLAFIQGASWQALKQLENNRKLKL